MAQTLKTDWVMLGTIVLMVAFGIVMVYSATSVVAEVKYNVESHYFVLRQAVAAVAAFVLLMLLSRTDYRMLRRPLLVFGSVGVLTILLVAVYFIGHKHRWFQLPFFQFQPSELAKPAVAVFLAG